tara:strand:- start:701 stop:2458 length:1758 start_codon:yes stop_codon:yes gene_type:complete
MIKKKQLISTNLSPSFKKEKDFFFLGSWCSKKFELINKKQYQTNRWNNHRIIKKDYTYLSNLFVRILDAIPNCLNKYHNLSFPKKFWQSLIWLWLTHYITSNYFRWKTVEKTIQNNKNLIYYYKINQKNLYIYNTLDFYKYISSSDYYNEFFFQRIIKKFKSKILIKKVKNKISFRSEREKLSKYNLKIKFLQKTLSIISRIFFYRANLLICGGFSFKNFLFLHFKKLFVPLIVEEEFKRPQYIELKTLSLENEKKRKEIKIKFKPKNKFESYIHENLLKDMPIFFMEKFKEELEYSEKVKINPKLIISSSEHQYNEKYKLWILIKRFFSKIKITILEHGGNHVDLNWDFEHDKIIGNKFYGWHKSKNIKKLPVPKYIGIITKKNYNRKNLVYCGYETTKYPSKISRSSHGFENLESIKNLKEISKNLNKEIYKNFFYCEKKFEDLRIRRNLINLIGVKKIKRSGSFVKELDKAKLMICDYPQTTFFDCILRCPTILVVDYKNTWQPNDHLKKTYLELKKKGVVFNDIKDAVKFINENWDNLDEWWRSKRIVNVKKKLLKDFNIETKRKSLSKWEEYISNNLYNF